MPKLLTDIQLWNPDRTEIYPPLTVSWNQASGTSEVVVTTLPGGVQAVWDQSSGSSEVTVTELPPYRESFSIIDYCPHPDITRRLGGVDELSLRVPAGSKLAVATNELELSQGKIIRLLYDDGSMEEWRIKSKSREFSGSKDVMVRAEPIAQDLKTYTVRKTLENGHTRASVSFYNQTLEDIAGHILSAEFNCPALFTMGTVEAGLNDSAYNLVLNASYIMQGLQELCKLAEAEWNVGYNATTDKYEINFYASGNMGGGVDEAADRPVAMGGGKGSRLQLEKSDGKEDYFSRIVPLMGQGSEIQTVAGAKWAVDNATYDSPNTTIALKDHAIAKDGYGLIAGKTIYFGNATDGWFEVLSTGSPNKLTVSGDASGLSVGTFKEGAEKNDVILLEDAEALEQVGLHEEKFARPDIVPYANLVDDAGISAAMSEWSGGLPIGMEKINGAETVTEETSELFVRHGTKAAKVSCGKDQGLQTKTINLQPEELSPYFSTVAYVSVESGSVRFELIASDGKIYPLDVLVEWDKQETRAMKIGAAKPPAGNARIKIIANENNTVFNLDALVLTQSAHAVNYAPLMGPKDLWITAGKYLKRYGGDRPDVWSGKVMDQAFFIDTAKEIEIGSFVKVQEGYNEFTQSYDTEFVVRVVELKYEEDRLNGRFRKTVRLADKNSDAARVFQEQYLTVGSQQASLGVKEAPNKGLYDRAEKKGIEDQFSALNQNLDELTNTKLPALQDELDALDGVVDEALIDISNLEMTQQNLQTKQNTLDGYLKDPSIMPDNYKFIEGIVTHRFWAEDVIARRGFFEQLIAGAGYFDSVVSQKVTADTIVGLTGFFEKLVTSDLWSNTATFNQAFIEIITSNQIWSDEVITNTLLSKNANITGILTIQEGGKINWSGGILDNNGMRLDEVVLGSDPSEAQYLKWKNSNDIEQHRIYGQSGGRFVMETARDLIGFGSLNSNGDDGLKVYPGRSVNVNTVKFQALHAIVIPVGTDKYAT